MVLLLALPIWVIFWNFTLKPNTRSKANAKTFMTLVSIALIFILGLRSRYVGTMDTYFYCMAFDSAKGISSLYLFLDFKEVFDSFFLFSEAGFHTYTWLAAQILPGAQWFLLLSTAIIVICTAIFIWKNSDDITLSWIVFICLGSMTFTMNGMRQAFAMSICLLAYEYVKRKKLFPFLIVVLIAILFHKSAMFFVVVYLMKNIKLNFKSVSLLASGVLLFFLSSNILASFYDSMTGEDYAAGESFESGGTVTILIYLMAIILTLVFSKRLKETEVFLLFALVVIGFSVYLARFISTQVYERISYYFAYFLIVLFPAIFKDLKSKDRQIVSFLFVLCAIGLYAYRISGGVFANFELFW